MAKEYLRGSVDGQLALIEFSAEEKRSVVFWGGEGRPNGSGCYRYTVDNASRNDLHCNLVGAGLVTDPQANHMGPAIESRLSGADHPRMAVQSPPPLPSATSSTSVARPAMMSGPGRGLGGMNDHHATWHFIVHAPSGECTAAFVTALSAKTRMALAGSQWNVRSGGGRVMVAVLPGALRCDVGSDRIHPWRK